MKRYFQAAMPMLLCLALLAGCGAQKAAESSSVPPTEPEPESKTFTAGTWLVQGQDTADYYFFDAESASGRTASLENGTGVAFTYTLSDQEVLFRMGAADQESKATITFTDEKNAELTWSDGQKATMQFISEKNSEEFHFYSNQKLCELAAAYYAKATGESAPEAAADLEPETVTVQLYENLGDHNSTYAWYQVNRLTAKGTDISSGAEIDLTSVQDKTVG